MPDGRAPAADASRWSSASAWCSGVLVRGAGVVSALLFAGLHRRDRLGAGRAGISISCGCFGGGGEIPDAAAAYPGEIARDVGLLASACVARRPARHRGSALDNVLFRTTDPDRHRTDRRSRPPITKEEASMAQKKSSHRTADEKAATAAKREARRARTSVPGPRPRSARKRPSARSAHPLRPDRCRGCSWSSAATS